MKNKANDSKNYKSLKVGEFKLSLYRFAKSKQSANIYRNGY